MLGGYIIIINSISFILFGIDKYRAIKYKWRVSENIILLSVLCGGFVGGLLGMILFHHKTIKTSFQLKFFLLVFIWIIIAIWIMYR